MSENPLIIIATMLLIKVFAALSALVMFQIHHGGLIMIVIFVIVVYLSSIVLEKKDKNKKAVVEKIFYIIIYPFIVGTFFAIILYLSELFLSR